MLIPILVAIVCAYAFIRFKSVFFHWEKLQIPFAKPNILFGNFKDFVLMKKPFFQVFGDIYKEFPNLPYVGIYAFRNPGILIRDPIIIKDILQSEFASFHDNDFFIDEIADPIFGNNPVTSRGEKWKVRRAMHTSQFSTGKIKYMYALLEQGGDRMIKFINDEIEKNGKCTIKTIELASKYTLYNVGNCTMGIDPRTFEEDNAELRSMGKKFIEPGFSTVKHTLVFFLPALANFLTVRVVPQEVTQKFRKMIKENLDYRKQHGIVRNDFFESIQEYKGEKTTEEEMLSQIGGFFVDAFGTNSAAINFILYELAKHPDIQKKLQNEIDKYLRDYNGKIPYETFQEMPYIEAVILEGLRIYPPVAGFFKLCMKKYTLPPVTKSAKPLTIEPNTSVIIPLISIQNDEKYFPDPERFDPTRFLPENKENIVKFSYLPFNEGPRACLGRRFALVQTKMMLLKLFSEFDISLNSKTPITMEFHVQSFLLASKGDIWIDVHRRRDKKSI